MALPLPPPPLQVTGEEEIPEGVVAVLTPDAPDVLSHVSVRARNMKVLFATCHDPEVWRVCVGGGARVGWGCCLWFVSYPERGGGPRHMCGPES